MRAADGGEVVAEPLGAASRAAQGDTVHVLQERTGPGEFAAALLHAARSGAARLVLHADEGAPVAARIARWFDPGFDVEVREVDGKSSRVAVPEPMPVVMPGPVDASALADELRSFDLEVVLEAGEWRGELAGLEVARIVRWPVETGGDGQLHIEAGVGRFDRDAAAAMHEGETPEEGLQRAIAIVSQNRRVGASGHPLTRLARSRWMRAEALADPGRVGAVTLDAVEASFVPSSVREELPAAALGRDRSGDEMLVVFSVGSGFDAVPVAVDTRELHRPGVAIRLVVPPRDNSRSLCELVDMARSADRGPVEVFVMEPPWTT